MSSLRIRPYDPKDAASLCAVFFDAVRVTGLRDYSEAQVKAWAPVIPDSNDFEARARDGRIVFVAVNESNYPIAYGDLEANGHIDHLFCRPETTGVGIGSALYDRIEQKARELKINRLFVEASEAARRLFLRKGFMEVKRHDFLREGVIMHNFLMEKSLAAPTE